MKNFKIPKQSFCFGIIVLVIQACSTLPGGIDVQTSNYDGTKQMKMKPGWAHEDWSGSATLQLGLFKTSTMAKDEVILVVRNNIIKNFDPVHPNFFVKIDGKEIKLSPISKTMECNISTQSDVAHCSQDYLVKLDLIENMINAKETIFKLNLRDNTYVTGSLWGDGSFAAKSGFKDFLQKVKKEFP